MLGTTVSNLHIIKELIFDDTAFDLYRMIYTWSDSSCITGGERGCITLDELYIPLMMVFEVAIVGHA